MKKWEKEVIEDNLRTFTHNFGSVRIEKEDCGRGFYVFCPASSDSYVQYCYNIDYLNGWLYGCVQAANRIVKPVDQDCDRLLDKIARFFEDDEENWSALVECWLENGRSNDLRKLLHAAMKMAIS